MTDIYGQYRLDYEANRKCKIYGLFSCGEFTADQKEAEKGAEVTKARIAQTEIKTRARTTNAQMKSKLTMIIKCIYFVMPYALF